MFTALLLSNVGFKINIVGNLCPTRSIKDRTVQFYKRLFFKCTDSAKGSGPLNFYLIKICLILFKLSGIDKDLLFILIKIPESTTFY